MINEQVFYEGKIHPDFKKKAIVRIVIWSLPLSLLFYVLLVIMMAVFNSIIGFSNNLLIPFIIMLIVHIVVIVLVILFSNIYYKVYIQHFSFKIIESYIIINHGVFRQAKATIPISRVQNISITSGILDRWCNIYNIVIETAGGSGFGYGYKGGGNIRGAEGFIPGQKDPTVIEAKIKEIIEKTSNTSQGLK